LNRQEFSKKKTGGFLDAYIAMAEKLSELSGKIAAYLLVPLVIVFLIEIFSRNLFNQPTTWAYGTCYIIGGCAAVLGFGYALKAGVMVRIDVIHTHLSEKTKCVLDLILFALIFLPLMLGTCYVCIMNAAASVSSMELLSTGSWNAPIWPTKLVMAVSMIIFTMQGLAEMCKLIKRLKALQEGE